MGFQIDDLDRIISFTEPSLHPDGTGGVVVHKKTQADSKGYESRLLYVSPNSGSRFLTAGPHDSQPVFSPDGQYLWFIRACDKGGAHLMRLPWQGGEAETVGPVFWDLNRVTPIPGRSAVLVTARACEAPPKHTSWPRHYDRWQWQYDGQAYFPSESIGLYLVETEGSVQRLEEAPYDVSSVAVSPDGSFAVYARVANEEDAQKPASSIFRISLSADHAIEAWTSKSLSYFNPAVLNDGRVVALGSDDRFGPATINALYEVHPHPQKLPFPADLELGESISSDTRFGAGALSPMPVGRAGVMVPATENGSTSLWFLDDSQDATRLSLGIAVVAQYAAQEGERGPTILATGGSLDQLDEVLWYQDNSVTVLTHLNEWAGSKLSPTVDLMIPAHDGGTVPAYIIGAEPDRPKPLILYVHGGPHGAYGETPRYDSQVMAERGYVVAQVNPRGSMGYGQEFRNAVRSDWGGQDMADLMTVVDHLIQKHLVDPDRLYITGGSYGGFMTSWVVGHTHRFRAASTVVPVTNLVSFYGTSDIGWWFAPGETGPTPWEDLEALWKASPLAYADKVKTPTQVVAGEDDRRCPIEQAEQYYTALKHFGVDTEFLRYPGPHSFSTQGRPDLRKDRLSRLVAWFDTH